MECLILMLWGVYFILLQALEQIFLFQLVALLTLCLILDFSIGLVSKGFSMTSSIPSIMASLFKGGKTSDLKVGQTLIRAVTLILESPSQVILFSLVEQQFLGKVRNNLLLHFLQPRQSLLLELLVQRKL